MRFKTKFMLTAGCVCLFAMSAPALGDPLPKPRPGVAQQKAAQQVKNTAQQKSAVHRTANARANARAPHDESAMRRVTMPITRDEHRPISGWPALVSEARKYMGTNPTAKTRLWCATFMNMVLAKTGYSGTNSDAAKSFAQYGRRISEPKVGAIAVLTRGKKGGHVGVVSGVDGNGNPIIISGNHNKRVGESVYPRARVIAYVMPTENRTGNSQLASNAGRSSQDDGFDSPIAELIAAIEAEQSGSARPRPALPQQTTQAAVRPNAEAVRARREVELEPAIAELLGIKQRGQIGPQAQPQIQQQVQPQQPPQRERRVEQVQTGRVASDIGLASRLGLPLSR